MARKAIVTGRGTLMKVVNQWFSKVFATFLPFRTWVPSFPPSKKKYLVNQSEEFFSLHPNL